MNMQATQLGKDICSVSVVVAATGVKHRHKHTHTHTHTLSLSLSLQRHLEALTDLMCLCVCLAGISCVCLTGILCVCVCVIRLKNNALMSAVIFFWLASLWHVHPVHSSALLLLRTEALSKSVHCLPCLSQQDSGDSSVVRAPDS